MKKIILTAIGLALFATPLAADNPHSGIAQHEKHRYGLNWHTPAVQVPVGTPDRFFVSPSGATQSLGLTLGANPAGAQFSRPYYAPPHQTPQDIYEPIHR
jgi:hypothetical protein